MITHKLSITKDPDTSDWVIQLTIKGQPDKQYMTMHPQRVYEPGTDENAWLRCELIRAQVPGKAEAKPADPDQGQDPSRCKSCLFEPADGKSYNTHTRIRCTKCGHETWGCVLSDAKFVFNGGQPEPDPNKVPDWAWEHAPGWAQWAAVDGDSQPWLWFYKEIPTPTQGADRWKPGADHYSLDHYSLYDIVDKDLGPVPDWTKSLTKRPKHLGGVE